MIVSALLSLVIWFLSLLFAPLTLLAFPQSVASVFMDGLGLILQGLRVLGAYTHLSYLLILFGVVAAFDAAVWLYKIIIWVLRKIPFLNIK